MVESLRGLAKKKLNCPLMSEHKHKEVFIDGAISSEFIAQSIAKHSSKYSIGGHSIFLGQVRNDKVEEKTVKAIEYSAYEEAANLAFHTIREDAFQKFDLTCLHIYHSLGTIQAGEICFFVFTSSAHRKPAIEACEWIVERVKKEVPIWGKEMFEDESIQWKVNNS